MSMLKSLRVVLSIVFLFILQASLFSAPNKDILSDFMDFVSQEKYEKAFALILPKLQEAWTLKRFSQDWKNTREKVKKWKPERVGFLSGASLLGPYFQAVYELDSNWDSV